MDAQWPASRRDQLLAALHLFCMLIQQLHLLLPLSWTNFQPIFHGWEVVLRFLRETK